MSYGPGLVFFGTVYKSESGSVGGGGGAGGNKVRKGKIPDQKPANLIQQLALNAAKNGKGEVIIRRLGDVDRLNANYGRGQWVKKQFVPRNSQNEAASVVHYFENLKTGLAVEFKFIK